jgi:hypothetical protein
MGVNQGSHLLQGVRRPSGVALKVPPINWSLHLIKKISAVRIGGWLVDGYKASTVVGLCEDGETYALFSTGIGHLSMDSRPLHQHRE